MRFWQIKKISMSFRKDCGDFLFLLYLTKEIFDIFNRHSDIDILLIVDYKNIMFLYK